MLQTDINKFNLTNLMELISVSSRGQVVIPERIRKKYGIRTGDRLVLLETDHALVIRKENQIHDLIEQAGWLQLAESGLKDVWDNPQEDKAWEYLQNKKKS